MSEEMAMGRTEHHPLCSAAGDLPCPLGCEEWGNLTDDEWEAFCEGAGIDPSENGSPAD